MFERLASGSPVGRPVVVVLPLLPQLHGVNAVANRENGSGVMASHGCGMLPIDRPTDANTRHGQGTDRVAAFPRGFRKEMLLAFLAI